MYCTKQRQKAFDDTEKVCWKSLPRDTCIYIVSAIEQCRGWIKGIKTPLEMVIVITAGLRFKISDFSVIYFFAVAVLLLLCEHMRESTKVI
jgi:hypothetical protein